MVFKYYNNINMRGYTTFTIHDYEGEFNILKHEKKLILLALEKANGNLKEAHKLLCPQTKPYYSYSFLKVQVYRHEIDIMDVRDDLRRRFAERLEQHQISEAHNKLVKENLIKLQDKLGIKLRSLE